MLFFYPKNLEIISRRIYYNHTSGILKRNGREKLTFKNSSKENLNEIILEIETFKTNLKIMDDDGNELIYLPNYKIANMKTIPDDILNGIYEKDDEKKIHILVIELGKPVKAGKYHSIFLDYIEYRKEEKDEKYANKHPISKKAKYLDTIGFYGEETISVFYNWDNGLEIEDDLNITGSNNLITNPYDTIEVKNDEMHMNRNNNCFSFSISYNYRKRNRDLDFIYINYTIMPEKGQVDLIRSLTLFTILFPLTDFISIVFNNILYLFDSLEIASVFILTVAFAQTRTRLISHENYIKLALVFAGGLFIVCLVYFILL